MADPTAEALRLGKRYVDLINERRLDLLDALMPPDFKSHTRVGTIQGLAGFKALMQMSYAAFPELHWHIEEFICAEGRVVLRYHWEAVQRAPFLGIPPTHKLVRAEGVEIGHVRDGQIIEIWNYADIMGLAAQLQFKDPLGLGI
ncbi:MAG: ester cyclase [Alphaproteobacteria bacterium]|nr:ester cyclase [Alphaproteobacteria bacterium]